MIAALLVLWRLLFYRPLILVMLLLVYSVAALLLVTVDSPQKGIAIAALAAFAAGGLTALLTDRLKRHSLEAGVIALPDHSRMMRRVQACFLVLFAAIPAALACLLGAEPLATRGRGLATEEHEEVEGDSGNEEAERGAEQRREFMDADADGEEGRSPDEVDDAEGDEGLPSRRGWCGHG